MNQPQNSSMPPSHISTLLGQDHYTPEEAAELLGMDIDVIYQAAHRGHLPALKVGNDIISIKRADLVGWLESR